MIFNYICLYNWFDQLAPEFFCLLFVFHIYYLFFTYFTQWHFQNLSLSLVFCLFVCLVVFTCLWWPLLGCEQKGGLSRANRPVKANGEEGPQQCKAAENGAKYWTQVKSKIKKYRTRVKCRLGKFFREFWFRILRKRKACIICHSVSLIIKIIDITGNRMGGRGKNHKTSFVLADGRLGRQMI